MVIMVLECGKAIPIYIGGINIDGFWYRYRYFLIDINGLHILIEIVDSKDNIYNSEKKDIKILIYIILIYVDFTNENKVIK